VKKAWKGEGYRQILARGHFLYSPQWGADAEKGKTKTKTNKKKTLISWHVSHHPNFFLLIFELATKKPKLFELDLTGCYGRMDFIFMVVLRALKIYIKSYVFFYPVHINNVYIKIQHVCASIYIYYHLLWTQLFNSLSCTNTKATS